MIKILQKGDRILREKAKEIRLADIGSQKIKKALAEMSQALAEQEDAVAIAAPQIGYPLSIFVVSGKTLDKNFLQNRTERFSGEKAMNDTKLAEGQSASGGKAPDMVFINPRITKLSREKEWMPEGCLSVRWFYGKARRAKKATIEAYDEHGKKFTRGGSGLWAQIFQHETDHLKGILFTDHAKDIKEEPPRKST